MSIVSKFICWKFKRSDDKRDAGLKTPAEVQRIDNIQYGDDEKWNVLDVYRPRGVTGKLPVIVSVHGGGWVYGDKERYQYYCMSLVQHGFAVVNFTYRLAPKHKHPSSLEDTNNVFKWVIRNSNKYGFDAGNIFAVGDSAGAHLLGLFCCLCTNEEYARSLPFKAPEGFKPKAVALNCGVYHMEAQKGGLTSILMKDFLPQKGTEEEMKAISVTEHLNSAFPPAFVMTAEGDFLKEAALPLVNQLKDLGVEAEYHYYGDKDHVLGHVFHCNMKLEEAALCNKDECEFFRRFITA